MAQTAPITTTELGNLVNPYLIAIHEKLNTHTGAISDIQSDIDGINTLLQSDNVNLDSVQELVDAIETVQASLDTILVNNLVDGGVTKALTAEQGKVLKGLVDDLQAEVDALVSTRSIDTIKAGTADATKAANESHVKELALAIDGIGDGAAFTAALTANLPALL